ncbi:SMP-30/gluconolactonase/LRE family protein [Flavobacteriaceae bacterium F89]|uniref:Regucalcin n=1 Tax=Cerina litoralis TaxID=2874477 RepID=A0AAE3EV67_9FLAO|nr:SMP-30/gluconolactonase/LRE family protein [Cerina litoralis]MCG2461637.1 SMP-30/gluconolactonase/LRE family protein [Cerina litoralis]
MEAELVVNSKSILGEGPVWHQGLQKLFWVDIEGRKIHIFDPKNGHTNSHQFTKMPGALVPRDYHNLLIAFDDGLAIYNWHTKHLKYKNGLGKKTPNIRANDGKCDPNGNFWIGTMHKGLEPNAGALYRFNPDFELSLQVPDRTISNGLAWSKDGTTMYYIDTGDRYVSAYDFDLDTSQISNKRIVFEIDPEMGSPDGMAIDSEDNLWIAHWGGFCVRQWDPRSKKILNTVHLPVPHVTSCAFGGPKLDDLYITTARSGLTEEQLTNFPLSGGIFKVKPGVIGRPTIFFESNSSSNLHESV